MFFVDFTHLARQPFFTKLFALLTLGIMAQPLMAQIQMNTLVTETHDLATRHGYFYKAGGSPQTKVLNASEAQFNSLRNQHFYSGLRVSDLELETQDGALRVSAIFSAGTGSEFISLGLPWSEFQALNQDHQGSGFALTDMETYELNEVRLFAGVWAPLEASQQILTTPTNLISFTTNYQLLAGQGYVLTDLEVFEAMDRPVYAGVFELAAETTLVIHNMNWNEFHEKFHELNADSYRMVDFESYVINGAAFYSAVWEPGIQEDLLAVVDPAWNMGPIESDATLEGLTLIDFEIFQEHPDKESSHEDLEPFGVSTKMGLVGTSGTVGTLMPLHNGSSSGPGN